MVGGRHVDLAWPPPGSPNGVISSYRLTMNGAEIYEGSFGNHTQTGLSVFTGYRFILTGFKYPSFIFLAILGNIACTSVGCSSSPEVTITTSQLPPEAVTAPSLFVQGPTSIEAQWTSPSQVNGILERYVLLVSDTFQSDGEPVYNTSDLFMDFVIRDLTRGQFYYVAVMACTGGGCTVSPPSTARTSESAPQVFSPHGVPPVRRSWICRGSYLTNPTNSTQTTASITGLAPWSLQVFRLEACTSAGCSYSPEVQSRTQEAPPVGTITLSVNPINARAVNAFWSAPAQPNGDIIYDLLFDGLFYLAPEMNEYSTLTETRVLLNTSRSNQMFVIGGLIPDSRYTVSVRASNSRGRVSSSDVMVTMPRGSPDGVLPPSLTPSGPTSILAFWTEPARNNAPGLFSNPTRAMSFSKPGLEAYTEYEFKLTAVNTYGSTESQWVSTFTLETVPGPVDPPMANVVDAYTLHVTWEPPIRPNGVIRRVNLYQNDLLRVILNGNTTEFTAVDLVPFSEYIFKVEICNNEGCSISPPSETHRTPQAPPSGQDVPTLRSDTPTSVIITWQPPSSPNGALVGYEIERRRLGSSAVFTVAALIVASPRRYRDDSPSITPYSTYEYRIRVSSSAGSYASLWAEVTTLSASPGGLRPPLVDVLGSTQILVSWDPPMETNGVILSYTIRMPQPIIYVDNITVTTYVVDSLTPYTDYEVTIEACTVGGCTESDSTPGRTQSAPPQGQDAPRADPITQTYISVIWSPPTYPNGPGIRYGLQRQKVRQPLETGIVFGLGFWELVFNGTGTSFQDRGLATFTTYMYRITTFNQIGFVTRCFRGALLELQGSVVLYYIKINSSVDTRTVSYPPDVNSTVLTSLRPNTLYALQLLISNGAYNVSSETVTEETLDGAPEGFDNPQYQVLSASSVQIMWRPPVQPNGDIISYTILLDGLEVGEVPESTLSFIISQLQPYTIYSVQVEVCTVYDCLLSNATIFTTLEFRPDISNTCGYVECSTTESVCGGQCYSGNRVCCGGSIQDYQPDYQCCDTNYLPVPSDGGSYVCCGGQFLSSREDHQCCNGQYMEVLQGQICCSDPSEDRAVVGLGDSCCDGVPFDSTGPQICCAGTFSDGFNSKCCGSSVVPTDRVCCEEIGEGRAYEPIPNNVCCGLEYVSPETALCCTSESGFSRAHLYLSEDEKLTRNDRCCGMEKISASDACCNGVGYNPLSHVCADRSSVGQGGCGLGVLCPVDQAISAYCNRCDFDTNSLVCAVAVGQFTEVPVSSLPSNVVTVCPTALTTIFSAGATTYSYLDTELSPYTTYEYAVSVHNTAGSATSQLVNATTNEAIPSGVQPPSWSVPSGVLDRIQLTWNEPIKPNGQIRTYILSRDGIEIFRGLADSFTDRNGIQPYQQYTYILSACTDVGCATSQEAVAATLEAAPDGFSDPLAISLDGYSVQISWQPPSTTNGIIREYQIHQVGTDQPVFVGDSNSFSFVHEGLTPFTSYEYSLTACTAGGCTTTNAVSAMTDEAPPQGVSKPSHVILSAFIIELYWREPSIPNGIITEYRLYRNGILSYSGEDDDFMFVDEELSPNNRYDYVLEALTGAGGTNSSTHTVQTPISAPEGIPGPTLVVVSATAVRATWTVPTIPNGDIVQYGLILMSGKPDQQTLFADDNEMARLVENLTPHTLYDVRVLACNDGGCGVGPKEYAVTFEAPPEEQGPPLLKATGPSVVEISWSPPDLPNGDITNYFIYRRSFGSSQELLVCLQGRLETSCTNAGQGLVAFSLYEYRVRVVNNEGETDSPWASIRTLEAPPVRVTQPVVVPVDSFAAQAAWFAPSQANGLILGYRIEYQEISNDPTLSYPIVVAATVDSNVFQTIFYGLSPFTAYNVRIVAFNSAGEVASPWSEVEQNPDGLSILLRWDPPGMPNGEIREYHVYEDEYLITPIYTGRTREYLFRRLSPFTEYTLVLEACTSAGCGRGDPQTVVTAEVAPDNQADPTIGSVDSNSVRLTWRRPVNPNGVISYYEVIRRSLVEAPSSRRRRDTDDSSFTQTQVIHTEYNTNADSFEYMDGSLQPFRIFEYRIRAVNSKGSTQSDWVSVQTEEAAPSGVLPPSVSLVPNVPDSVLIRWTPPGESNGIVLGYRLQRNGSAPFSFDADDELSYTDTGLEPYTVYAYSITVCSGGGCTSSLVTTIRTLESAPIFVSPPDPRAISPSQIRVNWTMPSLVTGEIINLQLKVDGTVSIPDLTGVVVIADLVPFQEYAFVLVACTSGGCSESQPAFERPFSAAPEVSWSEPESPNGVILRYELRRDGKLVYDGVATRWQDFGDDGRGLTPGQQYSYVVTAVSGEGRAISNAATVVTSADTPAGLEPPTLNPRTASVVTVQWQSPLFPNGQIQNFTLFVDGNRIYSGLALNFDAVGLDPFTEYAFFIQACTNQGCAESESVSARTLESSPRRQLQPTLTPLADNVGVASGIRAEWNPPSETNGIITGYQLFRRRIFRPSGFKSEPTNLFNSTSSLRYDDMDSLLMPDESYEYMVISKNGAGEAVSPWAVTRMLEGRPEGVTAPSITEVAATTLTVNVLEPSQPNGRITVYIIFRNGTEIGQTDATFFLDSGLEPFTFYSYTVRACTAVGCGDSNHTMIQTEQDTPTGLAPPRITEIDSTWVNVEWANPTDANGIISEFQFLHRPSCPLSEQPFVQSCQDQPFETVNKGLALNHNVSGLSPYTRYDFKVRAYNAKDFTESSTVSDVTSVTDPRLILAVKPSITSNDTTETVMIDWTGTFVLNGQLREYVLSENGDEVYSGVATTDTRPFKAEEYEFIITVVTNGGEVSYPAIIYSLTDNGRSTGAISTQWYQSVWFIAIVILIGIVILFILIGVALSRISPNKPYERERQPLPPRQRRAHNFTFASSFKYPDTESIMNDLQEDSDNDHDSFFWKYDDDDQMTNVSQTYSYTKEQTMFTDTHL
ncbi:putative usherin [Apostichopus japonicus]|uniref:Putative usherin n=1 Tax=Stichopus japonicus TaxID=307972 RepID=A0A2G8LQ51_STIJA|nr:putative usherin [Apostichopus japonicus]